MLANEEIPELGRAGLRKFGLTTGTIFVALFGMLIPWLLERELPLWPWIVAAPLWLLGVILPDWLRPVYRGWMRFGLLASRITTPIVLGVAFFLVFSPIALVRRALGMDSMARSADAAAASYRIPSKASSASSLERPF